jgi:hypothetical protein
MAGGRGFGGPGQEFNVPAPALAQVNQNSPQCVLDKVLGRCNIVSKDLNANGALQNIDLFKVTGAIRILELFGILTGNTTFTNCTLIHFNVHDGVNTHQLTAAAGPNMNGFALGSKIEMANTIANPAIALNADQGRTEDGGVGLVISPKSTIAPDGSDTYIRFTYTTTDTPIEAIMWFYIRWVPLSIDALVEDA